MHLNRIFVQVAIPHYKPPLLPIESQDLRHLLDDRAPVLLALVVLARPSNNSPLNHLTHHLRSRFANQRPSSNVRLLARPFSASAVSSVVRALSIQNMARTNAEHAMGRERIGEVSRTAKSRGSEGDVVSAWLESREAGDRASELPGQGVSDGGGGG